MPSAMPRALGLSFRPIRSLTWGAVAITALMVLAMPASAAVTPVLDDLDGPVDFAVLPDGSIWWIEYYSGNITRYDPGTGARDVKFHVTPVIGGERGAVGLGIDQRSADNGTFWIYYAVAESEDDRTGGINHLSRIDDGKETVLLTTTAAIRHNGGRIVIHPDGSLFVSTGENDLGMPAQDPDSLLGKVLHILPDGSAAPGNPHGRVYSLGHRNVYGLAYDPESRRLFATENGNAERDEINEILKGHNYGWPLCEGTVRFEHNPQGGKVASPLEACTETAFTAPIGEFTPTGTLAPTGAAILDGRLYWASWNEGSIRRMDEQANGTWTAQKVYQYGGRINDLEASPDGDALYYSNWTTIIRLDVEAPADAPRLAPAQEDASPGLSLRSPEDADEDDGRLSPALSPVWVVGLALLALALNRRR